MNRMVQPRQSFLIALFLLPITILPATGQKAPQETAVAPRLVDWPAAATTVAGVAEAIARQTGMEVDVTAIDGKKPIAGGLGKLSFWNSVEALAEQAEARVAIGKQGNPVRLLPLGKGVRNPVFVDGPFRVSARQVDARIDLQTGKALYDLTLEVAWEARLPVYRIGAQPRIAKGEDDAGRPVTANPVDSRLPAVGTATLVNVRLEGLTRASKQIALLQGSFRATAAEELLRFTFDDLTQSATKSERDVAVEFKKFEKQGTYWIADLQLHYPAQSAAFESFETYWLGRNRFTLLAPDKTRHVVSQEDVESNGSALRYRLKEGKAFKPANLKGWKLEYETPGVMREIPVRFELKGISLP
jgi:hypothetical protein